MTIVCLHKHEEEPAQNMKPGAAGEKQVSKATLKKQKRREAKKAAKQARDAFQFLHSHSESLLIFLTVILTYFSD